MTTFATATTATAAATPRRTRSRAANVGLWTLQVLVAAVYAFSAFSNFGILARQRCQVLPFFLVLLCLPEWRREGVISVEEALAGRDAQPDTPFPQEGADPYAAPAGRLDPSDPYAGVAFSEDPYRRFRPGEPGATRAD